MFRPAVPWLVVALVLLLIGGAIYVLADGLVETLSLGIIGLGAVVAVLALFYAVGLSEERERKRRR